jgi:hypothetical protein
MTLVEERALQAAPAAPPSAPAAWLPVAGAASLGAGAVHFAAAGAHGEHPQAVLVFTSLAVAQVGWGGLALARRGRAVALLGVLLGLASVVGWALAKAVGLPFDGLQVPEPVQLADATAAALAGVSTVVAALAASRWRGPQLPVGAICVVLASATVIATVATSGHHHTGSGVTAHVDHTTTVHSAAAHTPVPYDPALPIDLSGTPGVTPQQQAAAERLVTLTLARLPQWADSRVAERAGFRTIGDQFTGTEHLVNRGFLTDRFVLDPDHPESLVYDTTSGKRVLVAAMYMVAPGTPLTAVPDVGGALMQWHIHDNLCYSPSGYVQGITDAAGNCPAGLVKPVPTPMIHVWITKHACGPFAALEGIGGGTIAPGQTKLCDHAHGSR